MANVAAMKAAGIPSSSKLLREISRLIKDLNIETEKLAKLRRRHAKSLETEAAHLCDSVLPQLAVIRTVVDSLEAICPDEDWPMPTYEEILFIK